MRFRALLVAALIVTAGCAELPDPGDPTATAAPQDATPDDDGTATAEPTAAPPATTAGPEAAPPDPDEDRLGWEDGYWYNESVAVDRSDGLNESELDAVVSRAMARVERVREIEFEDRVPVEVISREAYRDEERAANLSPANRLHQNVKWEAMLMVDESTDAVAVEETFYDEAVGGYYDFQEERIVIVSDDTASPQMNEITLAQELFHALQDQEWDLSNYTGETVEENNALSGVVEGDGNYVDYLYERRCEAEWDCLLPRTDGDGGGGDIHYGMYFVNFHPYSDGPAFVEELHQDEGWEAVDGLYEDPPESTEQVIHPEKYGEDEPTNVTVKHAASNGWEVLDLGEDSIDYASFGEAGLASMVYYPTYAASVENGAPTRVTVPYGAFFNYEGSDLDPTNPYNYAFDETDGWDGDKLYPYVNDASAGTNETGYVWKVVWDSEGDAEEFVETYETILEYRNAEPVDDRPNTWRIPEGERFADAFWIQQDGDGVVVVNAPDVETLSDVRAGAGEPA